MPDDDELKGAVILTAGEDAALFPDIPRPVLKALYASVLGRKESYQVSKHRFASIDIDNITQLCMRVRQWVAPYDLVASNFRFVVQHTSQGKAGKSFRINYRSLESLRKYDPAITDPASGIEVYFSMIYINKDNGSHESMGFNIDFTCLYRHPYYFLRDDNSIDVYPLDNYEKSCTINVEYVDYIIAKSLVSVIEDWYDEIDEFVEAQQVSWISKYLRFSRHDKLESGNILLSCLPIFFGIVFSLELSSYVYPNAGIEKVIFFISFLLIFSISSWIVFAILVRKLMPYLHFMEAVPLLDINKGNKKQRETYWRNEVVPENRTGG